MTPAQATHTASALIETAQAITHYAPECADAYKAVALVLRKIAAGTAKLPRRRQRIVTGQDRREARTRVDAWMQVFSEQWQGNEPPSLRRVRREAKEAGVAPRDMVDRAYGAMWPLSAEAAVRFLRSAGRIPLKMWKRKVRPSGPISKGGPRLDQIFLGNLLTVSLSACWTSWPSK
jgi:hypothetical protein